MVVGSCSYCKQAGAVVTLDDDVYNLFLAHKRYPRMASFCQVCIDKAKRKIARQKKVLNRSSNALSDTSKSIVSNVSSSKTISPKRPSRNVAKRSKGPPKSLNPASKRITRAGVASGQHLTAGTHSPKGTPAAEPSHQRSPQQVVNSPLSPMQYSGSSSTIGGRTPDRTPPAGPSYQQSPQQSPQQLATSPPSPIDVSGPSASSGRTPTRAPPAGPSHQQPPQQLRSSPRSPFHRSGSLGTTGGRTPDKTPPAGPTHQQSPQSLATPSLSPINISGTSASSGRTPTRTPSSGPSHQQSAQQLQASPGTQSHHSGSSSATSARATFRTPPLQLANSPLPSFHMSFTSALSGHTPIRTPPAGPLHQQSFQQLRATPRSPFSFSGSSTASGRTPDHQFAGISQSAPPPQNPRIRSGAMPTAELRNATVQQQLQTLNNYRRPISG